MTHRGVATLLAGLALLVSCTGEPDPSPSPGTIPARNATEAALLPTFADALPTMDPDTFLRLLGQLKGTPVVVNFWGEWCPPCREDMPRLVAAHEEFGDRVQFLGVDVLDSRTQARSFMREFGMTFPSVFDVPDAIKTPLGLFGQPVTAFFRADGSLEFDYTGPIPENILRRHLKAIAG
jgi:cytochrome c biogenesis protein CcmG/thiol:disulfide interchange protein DsbE